MANSFKITVKNGTNLISFEVKTNEKSLFKSIEPLSTEIMCELENLNNTNTKLKNLGYKGNFFKFTTGRKCILSIEATIENENTTFIKSLEFSFSKLEKLTSPEDGLIAILEGSFNRNRNNVQIC
jgi:hypothetical protein